MEEAALEAAATVLEVSSDAKLERRQSVVAVERYDGEWSRKDVVKTMKAGQIQDCR